MRRLFKSLRKDERGLATVELALSATMLSIMVAGIADLSLAYSRKLALEQAAQRAIEKQMQTTGEDTPEGTLKSEAIAQAGGGLTADKITVTYTRYCDGVKRNTYLSDRCVAPQITTRYLAIQIYDDYTPILPITFGTLVDGKYRVRAQAGVRIQ
ncbi:TadE/TadG family type IV pilus assembly protein [Sphingomonas humi]|uniref:TadE-like domain-containing protein n=1 Tax=Sphingomonas humi TaxID=335630 RepID=A0ABP7S1H9_9SPHN